MLEVSYIVELSIEKALWVVTGKKDGCLQNGRTKLVDVEDSFIESTQGLSIEDSDFFSIGNNSYERSVSCTLGTVWEIPEGVTIEELNLVCEDIKKKFAGYEIKNMSVRASG